MNDLIELAIAKIQEQEVMAVSEMDRVYNQALHTAIAVVKGMQSAQPEIIRCKDCIYFDRYVGGIEKYQWDGFCADWARNTYEDWYCSRAERRTNDEV